VLSRGQLPLAADEKGTTMHPEQKLGEILVRLKVLNRIDRDRVMEALRRSERRQKFGQVARAMGLIAEEHILAALAVQTNLFPGIQRMTLLQILEYLHAADLPY
jgi:DNA-binding phage protein